MRLIKSVPGYCTKRFVVIYGVKYDIITLYQKRVVFEEIRYQSVAAGFGRHGMPPTASNDTGIAFCFPN